MTSPAESQNSPEDSSETSPLLRRQEASQKPPTPLPTFQLAILFLIQLCEPLTAIVIYSFVNQFVRSTGITHGDEKATGYYAGIIESLFFWTEGATALAWQYASDKFGRKPVLLLAPLGLGLSMMGFGLSESYWSLVIFRSFQGIFNGDVGVSKTVMGEITDETNRADTMAFIPATWSVGTCLAPFIGGVFSSPAEHWPNSLGKIKLLTDYPYFLPCAISGSVCLATFALAFVGLNESAPAILRKKNLQCSSSDENEPSSCPTLPEAHPGEEEPPSVKELLADRRIALTLAINGLYAMCTMFSAALQPLIWSTSIENGGLGFTAFTIGTVSCIYGIPNSIFAIGFLGRLLRRFGPKRLTVAALVACLISLGLYPLQTYFASEAGKVDWRVWTAIVVQLVCLIVFRSGFASMQLFLVSCSPSPLALGTIQGLAQTIGVACRGVAPTLATSLWAYSKEHNVWGGQFGFCILGAVVVVSLIAVRAM